MEQQDWEGKELDKDFLCIGKKKIYSPETCVFLPHNLNIFLTPGGTKQNNLPIGVYLNANSRFIGQIKAENGTTKYLGSFNNEMDAHFAWLKEKHRMCVSYISTYKHDKNIHKALVNVEKYLTYHLENNKELTYY